MSIEIPDSVDVTERAPVHHDVRVPKLGDRIAWHYTQRRGKDAVRVAKTGIFFSGANKRVGRTVRPMAKVRFDGEERFAWIPYMEVVLINNEIPLATD